MEIVILGGAGHIGLPLAVKCAEVGHHVSIVDTNVEACKVLLERHEAIFHEPGLNSAIERNFEMIDVYSSPEVCSQADVVFLATSQMNLEKLLIASNVNQKTPILVRQTVRLYELTKLVNKGWNVVFVPERIAQGRVMEEIVSVPQIIGFHECAVDALIIAKLIFSWVEKTVLPLEEAVFAKLMCNFYRYGTFALANQLYIAAETLGFDFTRMRDAAMFDYPRMDCFPQGGWSGGFCLPKDTQFMAPWCQYLVEPICGVNERLFPLTVISIIKREIDSGKTVGILGMSSMKNVDDFRGSLRDAIVPQLNSYNIDIPWHDPYDEVHSSTYHIENVLQCDVVVIGIPHTMYTKLCLTGKEVIDPWGVIRR